MIKPLQQFTIVFLLLFSCKAFSQTVAIPDIENKTETEKSNTADNGTFKIGSKFVNNFVFYGRADTATTPLIMPEIKYTLSNGIFFSGSLYYDPKKKKGKIDGGELSGGYNFDITDNLSGGASFTKMFYGSTSTQIASSISSIINGNITYDIGDIISPSLSVDYNINDRQINNDAIVSLDISHDFLLKRIFGDKDQLTISPTITVNAGTENFYDSYLINTKKIRGGNLSANQANPIISAYISKLSQFELLDFELSVPFEYKVGRFMFELTPTYAIVKNQLPPSISARLYNAASIFYFEGGVFLEF
ncbi:MAG: hypothetical protein ABI367_11655 [Mucilaginibacter sp.]